MLPTHEAVKAALHYNEETGVFTWKVRPNPRGHQKPGDVAGCTDKRCGYVLIRLARRLYLAHRLAWFYVTGEWPKDQIDHRDGNKGNNAFGNLRDVTNQVNGQNLRTAKRSSLTRLLGASKTENGRFRAYITPPNRKTMSLGTFDTAEEAHNAYIQAKRQLHEGNTL